MKHQILFFLKKNKQTNKQKKKQKNKQTTKSQKKYSRLLSAAVVIGPLMVKCQKNLSLQNFKSCFIRAISYYKIRSRG